MEVNFLEDGEEPGHGIRAALTALALPNMPSRDANTGFEIVRIDHFNDPTSKPIDEQTYEDIESEIAYPMLTCCTI